MSSVDQATQTIQNNLDQSGLFGDVSHDELRGVTREFQNLSGADARQVFDNLTDDQLRTWAEEMNSGAWFGAGGLSAGEKTDLFNALAERLSGAQLAEFSSHLGRDDAIALGQAVAGRATADTKVDYVQAMAGRTSEGERTRIDSGFGYANTTREDPDARAVGEVLASLGNNPSAFNRAVGALSDSQLSAVMASAARETMFSSQGAHSVDYDPQLLTRIIDAAGASGDVGVKARVFEAGAAQLDEINKSGAFNIPYIDKADDARQVGDALTRLLNSDVNGIVGELQAQVDPTGESLAVHAKHLLENGQEAQVRSYIQQLQHGNDGRGDAYQRFGATTPVDGQPTYLTARNLGYYAGATGAAINSITDDRNKQAELLKNVFGTGFGAVGAINTPAGVIASVGNGLTSQAIMSIYDQIKEGDKDLKTALYELAIPSDGNGRLYNGPARTDFNAAYSVVPELNR